MLGFGHIGQYAIGFIQDNAAAPVYLKRVSRVLAGGFSNTRPAAVAELEEEMKFAIVNSDYNTVTVADSDPSTTLVLDTEIVDADNLVTLSGNTVTFALAGYYDVLAIVNITVNGGSAVAADGYLTVEVHNSGDFDTIYAYHGTPSGTSVGGWDFEVAAPLNMPAGGTMYLSIYQETGHNLDAYVTYLVITKK